MKTRLLLTAGLTAGLIAGQTQAHVTLEQAQAPAGSVYKAVLRVGHGCAGSATTRLSVRLPMGLKAPHPVPKPGWTLTLSRDPAGELTAVSWTANTPADALQDAWYDEFVLRTVLPKQPGPLTFAVRQDCEVGSADWAGPPDSPTPAVLLRVLPPN